MNEQDRKVFESLWEEIVKQGQTQARIDERTINIYSLTEKLEKHNADQNGFISTLLTDVASNKAAIKWIKFILAGAGLAGGGAGLSQWLGG